MDVRASHPIDWKAMDQEADVKRMLEKFLPRGTSLSGLQSFARSHGFECSALVNDLLYCSTPAHSELDLTRAKWLMVFHFEENRLVGIDVTRGLIGP